MRILSKIFICFSLVVGFCCQCQLAQIESAELLNAYLVAWQGFFAESKLEALRLVFGFLV